MRYTILHWVAYALVLLGILLHDQFLHQRGIKIRETLFLIIFGTGKIDQWIMDLSFIWEMSGSSLEGGKG
jgi:hypothetical protein